MTGHVFTELTFAGAVAPYLVNSGQRCDTAGMSIMAMPPGRVEIDIKFDASMLNVVPFVGTGNSDYRLNGEKITPATDETAGVAFFGGGSDMTLICDNPDWEILLEFPRGVGTIASEQFADIDPDDIEMAHGTDPVAAMLGQLAIDHFRQPVVDRLYLEGLAISMTARTLAFAASNRNEPSTRGTDARVERAIAYIHSKLTSALTVDELAAVACMSPSWFSRAFKAHTGWTVHAYVLERRLERARLALQTTNEPIGNIAYACGFADHSHLTRLFRRRYGASPSAARD